MSGCGTAFEEMLDECIREIPREPPPSFKSPSFVVTGTAAAYGFFVLDPVPASGLAVSPSPAVPVSRSTGALRNGWSSGVTAKAAAERPVQSGTTVAAPPARRLSRRQREALEILTTLGADIRQDFTATELRSAFRALARRYHPDRHTDLSGQDATVLSRLFGHAREAYRILASAS